MCDTGNLGILFGDTFCRIDHDQYYICTFYRRYSTDDTVTFQFFFNFALSSKSGSINEDIIFSVILNVCINCISGRSGYVRYDHTLLSCQLVNDRRFSYVRFSYDCHSRTFIFFFFRFMFREMCDHCI